MWLTWTLWFTVQSDHCMHLEWGLRSDLYLMPQSWDLNSLLLMHNGPHLTGTSLRTSSWGAHGWKTLHQPGPCWGCTFWQAAQHTDVQQTKWYTSSWWDLDFDVWTLIRVSKRQHKRVRNFVSVSAYFMWFCILHVARQAYQQVKSYKIPPLSRKVFKV
jgi:hypothetical protein